MNNTIIYLIGFSGVGKLTVARRLCAATGARLFDNHLINNVIFSLIRRDGATPMPERVWELTGIIREQAVIAVEELAPSERSFVVTNCLVENDPADRLIFERIVRMAQRRGARFVPVLLRASDAAHVQRVSLADRAEYFKMTDIGLAEGQRRGRELLHVEHPNRLDLDTTSLPPYPDGEVSTTETVDLVTERLESVIATVRDVHDAVDEEDPTSADILHVVLEELEQFAWMVSAENRTPA